MGYQIQYGNKVVKKQFVESSRRNQKVVMAVISICACCVFAYLLTHYKEALLKWLLPGDPEITRAAISTLGRNLRNGIALKDAVHAFCEEILSGAVY